VYSPAAGALLTAGPQILSVTFTPSNSNYATSTDTVMLQVNQATSTISWSTPTAITYGTPLGSAQLDATASVLGSFVYSPPAGTVLNAGPQLLSVSFTPTESVDYTTAASSVSLTVNPASQSIAVTTPAPATATLGSSFTVVASASTPVTFGSSGGCTNSGATYTMASTGSKACTETINAAGSSNYSAAPQVSETTIVAKPITPTVSFTGAPATATYNTSFTVEASSDSASIPTFTTTGPCTIDSATLVVTMTSGTGMCTMTATWAANDVYAKATATQKTTAEKVTSIITWSNPAPIIYGTTLGGTEDATANVPGAFVYTPAANKVLTAGLQSLSVKFTPTQTSDYTTVTADVELTVNPVGTTTSITKVSPNPSTVGQPVTVSFSVAQAITNVTKPTGSVTVNASTGESCTATLSGGKGSCEITPGTAGNMTVTATYPGDANNNGSVSSGVTQTVN
jgi:hypothetical protein